MSNIMIVNISHYIVLIFEDVIVGVKLHEWWGRLYNDFICIEYWFRDYSIQNNSIYWPKLMYYIGLLASVQNYIY